MENTFLRNAKLVVTDIRFWLLVFFLIRLETINLPPLDEHAWRQTITLGVAKSYLEVDASFFEPKTVICDSREGIQAQEFPILNYLIFLLWKIFGVHNWVFRLLTLLVATAGLYYFYCMIKRLFDHHVGFAATVIFAVSVAFMYARKAMPDVFAVSLCITGIEFGYRYLEKRSFKNLLLFIVLLTLGLLSKMPAAVILPFGMFLIQLEKDVLKQNMAILLGEAIALSCMIGWYYGWVPWATEKYAFPLFYPTTFAEGYKQLMEMKTDLIARFYPIALTSQLSFLAFLVGLVGAIIKKDSKLWLLFGASTVILVFFMLKTGGTFAGHKYYIIPFVPAMSLVAGYAISLTRKYAIVFYSLLILISVEAIISHKPDFFVHEKDRKYLKLAGITSQFVPKSSRILVNEGTGQPLMMYMAERRGWTVNDRMKDTAWVNSESTVGLKYLLINKAKWADTIPYPVLFDDVEYRLYKVGK